jgi:predicted nucleic acid-binding protein
MALILDASAACELLLRGPGAGATEEAIARHTRATHAPHLLDLEVISALRRKVRASELTPDRAAQALEVLGKMPIVRLAHTAFAFRIWALRERITPYDAAYVALAEALDDAELITADRRLARALRRHPTLHVTLVPS